MHFYASGSEDEIKVLLMGASSSSNWRSPSADVDGSTSTADFLIASARVQVCVSF